MSAYIDLPWPDKNLHPNARVHWAVKARAVKKARTLAGWLANGIGPIDADGLYVCAVFSPPDNRRRDTDGMLSSIKSYFDGIADVVGVDDSRWQIAMRRAEPCKGGNVRIEIIGVGE